jgi:hypothetical protein
MSGCGWVRLPAAFMTILKRAVANAVTVTTTTAVPTRLARDYCATAPAGASRLSGIPPPATTL